MVILKTTNELQKMRKAGKITAQALELGGAAVKPGITTGELDRIMRQFILSKGAKPSFLGFGGFPKSACISVNDEVIHGIPGKRVLREGDIVSIDIGAYIDGYHGDSAATFAVGTISDEAARLMAATRESLMEAIAVAQPGKRLGDIGAAVQNYVTERGFSVVREYVGHGVGHDMHEEPEVPNFRKLTRGIRLRPGMTLAVEPMINEGTGNVEWMDDNWTVVTQDGKLSAHYENTILITKSRPEILSITEDEIAGGIWVPEGSL